MSIFAGTSMHLQAGVARKSQICRSFIRFAVKPAHPVGGSAVTLHLCLCWDLYVYRRKLMYDLHDLYSRAAGLLVEAEPMQQTLPQGQDLFYKVHDNILT